MGFDSRLLVAKKFEEDVEAYLESHCGVLAVAKNGTEHTHPDFVDLLRTNNCCTSKLIRFAPDGVYLSTNKSVFHWEAKASINIERDAYETYMKYNDMGCQVVLFAKDKKDIVYWQFVNEIKFIESADVVAPFPSEHRFPIDDAGWLCPRKSNRRAGRGSGTPYKEIDFKSMRLIPDFYGQAVNYELFAKQR